MLNFTQLSAIILAGISVGVADALIKKIALTGSFWSVFKNPLLAFVLILYFAQIIFFIYVFRRHWGLGITVNIQIVFYSLTVVLCGLFFSAKKFH